MVFCIVECLYVVFGFGWKFVVFFDVFEFGGQYECICQVWVCCGVQSVVFYLGGLFFVWFVYWYMDECGVVVVILGDEVWGFVVVLQMFV